MFEKLVSFTKKVSDLADKPALTPAELKSQFDAAPDEVRVYLNKLIDAMKSTASGDSGAKNTGATTITGLTGNDVQTLLEGLMPASGSNSIGDWLKFPDGTMICKREIAVNADGSAYYDGENSYTFAFVGNPMPIISAYNNFSGKSINNASEVYVTSLSNTQYRWGVKYPAGVPSGNTIYVRVIAFGRWK